MEIKTAVLTTHIFGGSSVCRLKKCKEGVSGSQRVGLQKSVLEENSAAAFLWRSLGVAEEDNVDGQLCILRAFRWLSTMSNNNWLVAFCVGLHVWLQWVIARHWVKNSVGTWCTHSAEALWVQICQNRLANKQQVIILEATNKQKKPQTSKHGRCNWKRTFWWPSKNKNHCSSEDSSKVYRTTL